jgi:DNA-binding response OmpR family regulator
MKERNLIQGKRVLLVDDEPDILETLEDLLPDCITTTATSFEEAQARMEENYYDIAILDIMGVSGYELLKIANEKKIVTVMLTARAVSADNIVKSYEDGAAYYVPKEEMQNIETYLNDILNAIEQQKSPWDRWFSRMSDYCERTFGEQWRVDEKGSWDKLPFGF